MAANEIDFTSGFVVNSTGIETLGKKKRLTQKMQGYVGTKFEDYGFIQPTTTMPSAVRANQVRFRTSSVEGPAVKSGDFVSFLLNFRFPDKPFAIWVKKIPKCSPNKKRLTQKMQGYVDEQFEDYGFIQPITTMPSDVKANQVHFRNSSVEGPAVKSGNFVSFLLNFRFPDEPFAVWVKKIPKCSPQGLTGKNGKCTEAASDKKIPSDSVPGSFKKKDSTLSELGDLLCATVISVNGKSGFMRHTHDLPPPYNHTNKIVQFETPGDLMGKPPKKGQQVVFTLDKDSQKKLVAKDVAFLHTSYNPKSSIPYKGDSCDHILFRNKGNTEHVIACHKGCSRKLRCGHTCPNKCIEKCPGECKICGKKNSPPKKSKVRMKKCEQQNLMQDLKDEMHGQVVHLTERYGFIEPTRNVPETCKRTCIYFNLSEVDDPSTITFRSFVSFGMNIRYPDRPRAVSVKKITKDCVQELSEKAYTLSDLDGLLYATIVCVNGKYGFMKPIQAFPPPYNESKLVQFVTPAGILDKSYTKGQQVVFTLQKESKHMLTAKDVAFVHASYNPTTTLPCLGELCDHICFRNKDMEGMIACQKDCSRTLGCTHACPKKCFEKCPVECKQCRKKNKSGKTVKR